MGLRQLRKGFTTGTCASAAAKAAAVFLLRNKQPEAGKAGISRPQSSTTDLAEELAPGPGAFRQWGEGLVPSPEKPVYESVGLVSVPLPGGGAFSGEAVAQDPEGELAGYWGVKKDSGDDPDVTNGIWICARVVPISQRELERLHREGPGYAHEDCPRLYLNGGPGIGMVTKPGLACPPGHYAINPVPQTMILRTVREVVEEWEYQGCLEIRLAVPEGEELAARTFNPELGILGGISILGTTGIVEPMSEEALVETIRLDIRTKAWENPEVLLMTPGNYGSTYLKEALGIPEGQAVKCSNFVADSVKILVEEGVRHLVFAGHLGKLVKVAGGVENTHSRYGDRRMEIMEMLAKSCVEEGHSLSVVPRTGARGGAAELLSGVRRANTTDEAIELLAQYSLAEPVLALAASRVKAQMEQWGKGKLTVEVIVFSSSGLAGKTDQAQEFLDRWEQRKAGWET